MTDPEPGAPRGPRSNTGAALAASALAALLAGLHLVGRLGCRDDHLAVTVRCLGAAWFLFHFPFAVRLVVSVFHRPDDREWGLSEGALFLAGMAVLLGLGTLGAGGGAVVYGGVGLLVLRVGVGLTGFRLRPFVLAVVFLPILALGMGGVLGGFGYLSATFLERLGEGVGNSRDTLFHATVANMFRTHGVSSFGLDGLDRLRYHSGTHFYFARLCDLLDIPVILFFQIGYPVIFCPLFVLAVSTAGAAFAAPGGRAGLGFRYWFLMLTALFGVLPVTLAEPLGWYHSYLCSESFCLALAAMLFAAAVARPTLLRWERTPPAAGGKLPFAAAFVLVVTVLFFLKVSVGALVLAAAGYLIARAPGLRRDPFALAALAASVLIALAIKPLVVPREETMTNVPTFVQSRLADFAAVPFFMLLQSAWVLAAVGVRVWSAGDASPTVGGLAALFRSRRHLDMELLIVTAVLGLIPAFVLPIDFNAYYFYTQAQWLAVPFVLAGAAAPPGSGVRRFGDRTLAAVACWALCLWAAPFNVVAYLKPLVAENLAGRGFGPGGKASAEKNELVALVGAGRLRDADELVAARTRAAEASRGAELVNLLRSFDAWPVAGKRETVLHVPRSNRTYWEFLAERSEEKNSGRRAWNLQTAAFMGPALSGLAMLEGYPPEQSPQYDAYFSVYPGYRNTPPAADRPVNDRRDELSARAAAMGFRRIVVLDADADGRLRLREWCLGDAQPVLGGEGTGP